MNRHLFIQQLFRKPYTEGARGPDAYDCYGLVSTVSLNIFGRELPIDISKISHSEWKRISMPEDGAIVFMGGGASDRHVGIYLKEGGVLHTMEKIGVVFDHLSSLPMRGFGRVRMFKKL